MQIPTGVYSSNTDYNYGYNGMEKDDELKGGGKLYSTLFREGDTENGRWWSRDPLERSLVGLSPYTMMSGNPILLTDKKGDDTISVNRNGEITKIVENSGNHVILDYNKNQLKLNEPEYDTKLIDEKGVEAGDKLINYISEDKTKELVDKQGKIEERALVIAGYMGMIRLNDEFNFYSAISNIWSKSYDEWDFSHKVLALLVDADDNPSLGERSRSGISEYRVDFQYASYYFFVFGDQKTAYNLGDAGNFMWGLAGRRSGFSWIELKIGSNGNEVLRNLILDSKFDQKAIENGFDFEDEK